MRWTTHPPPRPYFGNTLREMYLGAPSPELAGLDEDWRLTYRLIHVDTICGAGRRAAGEPAAAAFVDVRAGAAALAARALSATRRRLPPEQSRATCRGGRGARDQSAGPQRSLPRPAERSLRAALQ